MADFDTQRALQKNRVRRRGIFLLPNLLTTGALFAGFYAIVQAMNLRFDQASIAIFIAMVLDGLDGRVARLTRTQSAFGAEYDSLADMVSFGAAPALIVYEWSLKGMGKLGWIAAFVYVAGAALRLARFNTMLDVADKRWFTGIPSPAAAALVAGFVWIVDDYNIDPATLRWWAWVITVFAGPHDGQQHPLLQLQDDQPEAQRAVPCHFRVRAGDRAPVLPAGDRDLRRLRRLRDLGLRGVGVARAAAPAQSSARALTPKFAAKPLLLRRNSGYSAFHEQLAHRISASAPFRDRHPRRSAAAAPRAQITYPPQFEQSRVRRATDARCRHRARERVPVSRTVQ